MIARLQAAGVDARDVEGGVWIGVPDRAFAQAALRALGVSAVVAGGGVQVPADAVDAVLAVCAPECLLFDLDGVLADVSQSYRAAIVAAAAAFGVTLTPAAIAAGKAEGDANNDWVLTRRLMARQGVEVSLEAVTEAFEAAYQGTDDAPGLWRTERLLVDLEWLGALGERWPLGIVTGRPRGDADRFFGETGLGALVAASVTMHEAAAKPDPAPVRLCLERLGRRRAWLV
ncbi:MAG: HAD hydrolase-like protein, partial [Myxococcales bacterium]|nr:HAD hydrolase-like protein [Myxococcales bacterium]